MAPCALRLHCRRRHNELNCCRLTRLIAANKTFFIIIPAEYTAAVSLVACNPVGVFAFGVPKQLDGPRLFAISAPNCWTHHHG
jgi:hypothetical protein